jgi:hypothetical protein
MFVILNATFGLIYKKFVIVAFETRASNFGGKSTIVWLCSFPVKAFVLES